MPRTVLLAAQLLSRSDVRMFFPANAFDGGADDDTIILDGKGCWRVDQPAADTIAKMCHENGIKLIRMVNMHTMIAHRIRTSTLPYRIQVELVGQPVPELQPATTDALAAARNELETRRQVMKTAEDTLHTAKVAASEAERAAATASNALTEAREQFRTARAALSALERQRNADKVSSARE